VFVKKIFVVCIILCLFFVTCSDRSKQEAAIIGVFNDYITYGKSKNYEKLSEIVSGTTLAYFSNCINKALYAPKEAVMHLPLFDKIFVFYIRAGIPKERVCALNAKDLIKFSYECKLNGIDTLQNMQIKEIKINNKIATAAIVDESGKYSCPIEFEKEGMEWKMNIVPIINMINQWYSANADKNMPIDEVSILQEIGKELNIKIDTSAVYEPIKK
jgi:hypothetical protein